MLYTLITAAAVLATSVQAHTYLITPPSRLSILNNIGTSTEDGTGNSAGLCHMGDGTQTCCTSTQMSGNALKSYQRGDEIPTAWWRNNHVGGFIRYSIVPTDQSGSQDAFDAPEAMLNYECNQVGCTATYGGSSPNNWNGGDSAGSKGWSNACSGAFKIPYHMPDGDYTVQWVWFGQGNGNNANSPFQACIDLKISGGPTGSQPKCPLWKGGDTSEAGSGVCTYVSVNGGDKYQGVCKSANACPGQYTVGIPQGLQQCLAGNAPSTFPLMMAASASGAPDTFSSYSADGSSTSSSSSSSNSTSSSGSSDSSDSSSSGSSVSSANSSTSTSTSNKKKCSSGSKKRRHYGKRSHVRKSGLEFAYSN